MHSGLLSRTPNSDTSFFIYFFLFIAVCIIYIFLIFYLDAVWPFKSTPSLKWNFIFKKSFWSTQKSSQSNIFSLNPIVSEYIEPLPKDSEIGVKVINISKSFGVGADKKYAVSNLSLDFAKGQIHVLLGHNGAGKTTLMNMISGLLIPTSGAAKIAGFDIQTQTQKAQANMSICPQHNLLFDNLTVKEHLILFAVLKNKSFKEAKISSLIILNLVKLTSQKNTLVKKLSGGMKRKLQLSLTLVGETPIIILDEPTSGLDPEARRFVWDVLLEAKSKRTILLTTHIMEEADAIGDRISIISNGELRCVGSPLFLKKLYGTGYILHLSINNVFNQTIFDQFIKMNIPQAYILRFNSAEAVYCIPESSNQAFLANEEETIESSLNQMSNFFNLLDQKKQNLGIEYYGVSITTIDDVFLKVTDLDQSSINGQKEDVQTEVPMESSFTSYSKLHGLELIIHQFKGLFLKRFHYAKRNWLLFLVQAIVPCTLVIITFTFLNTFDYQMLSEPTSIEISLRNFPKKIFYVGKSMKDSIDEVVTKEGGKVQFFDKIEDVDKSLFDIGFKEYKLPLTAFNNFTIWSNLDNFPSLSIAINVLQQALLKHSLGPQIPQIKVKKLDPKVSITTIFLLDKAKIILLAIFFPIIVALISASIVLFPHHENQIKVRIHFFHMLQLLILSVRF